MNKEKIIIEYLPLVRSIATKYNKSGISREDLEQEGMIGLLKATNKYKNDKGAKFSTYATYWIKKYVLAAIDKEKKHFLNFNKQTAETKKENISEDIKPITDINLPFDMPENEKEVLILLYEEELTLREIACKLNISRERVRQLKEKALRRMRAKSKLE